MDNASSQLSSADILGLYRATPTSERSGTPRITARNDLTPTARYIMKCARKRLQQSENTPDQRNEPSEEQLLSLILASEASEGEPLTPRERNAALAALQQSLNEFDFLTPFIEQHDVNDIIIRAHDDISIQKGRLNQQSDLRFPDSQSYKIFVDKLLLRVGKACTTATPVVDAVLPTGERLCVTHESFSPPGSGPMLTIRLSRHREVSIQSLIQSEMAPRELFNYILAVVSGGVGAILISGEVGTGKTTLARALVEGIPQTESILIIEDTHEFVLSRPFVRTLLTRESNTEGAGRITPAAAIRAGMRMAMNRIVLGEMRDGEAAEAFIDVCTSGHSGFSTIHARSSRDALARLELFLGRAQSQYNSDVIKRQIAQSLAVVVHVGLDARDGRRRIREIVEVQSANDGAIQLSPLFSLHDNGSECVFRRDSGLSRFTDRLRAQGASLDPPGTLYPSERESAASSPLGNSSRLLRSSGGRRER